MGYESRLYIMEVNRNNERRWKLIGECVAVINMSKMGYDSGFYDLFKNPVDYEVYSADGEGKVITEDCYGDSLKSAPIADVIAWLKNEMNNDDYRRLPVLYGLLTSFKKEQWDTLEVVHYGY